MSIRSLMVHTCDILRRTATRGAGGGQVVSWTTRETGLACRARPLKPEQVAVLAKDEVFADYRFYFATNPAVDTRDYISFTDQDGNELKLKVVATYNPHELDRFWKVYANTVKD